MDVQCEVLTRGQIASAMGLPARSDSNVSAIDRLVDGQSQCSCHLFPRFIGAIGTIKDNLKVTF